MKSESSITEAPHCVVNAEAQVFECKHCGAREPIAYGPVDEFCARINEFIGKHGSCVGDPAKIAKVLTPDQIYEITRAIDEADRASIRCKLNGHDCDGNGARSRDYLAHLLVGRRHAIAAMFRRMNPPEGSVRLPLNTPPRSAPPESQTRLAAGAAAEDLFTRGRVADIVQAERDAVRAECRAEMSFALLREANVRRAREWNGTGEPNPLEFEVIELCGEAGELANAAKKLCRHRLGMPGGTPDLQPLLDEIGDVVICCDLVARNLGADLAQVVAAKFNLTSRNRGMKTMLPGRYEDGGRRGNVVGPSGDTGQANQGGAA